LDARGFQGSFNAFLQTLDIPAASSPGPLFEKEKPRHTSRGHIFGEKTLSDRIEPRRDLAGWIAGQIVRGCAWALRATSPIFRLTLI